VHALKRLRACRKQDAASWPRVEKWPVSIGVVRAVLVSTKWRVLLRCEVTPSARKIEMPKTFRLWLLASCLCSTFAFAPTAGATQPPTMWTSKPQPGRVKLRLPTFIAFGAGGFRAGSAMTTSFAAKRGNDPTSCDSRCTEHAVTQRRLLLATGVLTGMAAAGIGVGITLMLKAPKDPSHEALRPRIGFGFSNQKAVAKIGWAF
jgi:hypothetical protein